MTPPPFKILGRDKVTYHCLAYASVRYRNGQRPRIPAQCGLYYTKAAKKEQFHLIVHSRKFGRLAWFPVDNAGSGTIASILLHSLVYYKIPPSAWRLSPIKKGTRLPADYRKERIRLIEEIRLYRIRLGSLRRYFHKLLDDPLFFVDPKAEFLALLDTESSEIDRAMKGRD